MSTVTNTNTNTNETPVETATSFPVRIFTDSCRPDHGYHRLVVIRWKETKSEDGKTKIAAKPARCVSVPRVSIMSEPAILTVPLQAAFEDMQDSAIRELIEEALANNDQNPVISPDSITPDAISAFYQRQAASGRLSTDGLKTWFDASLYEALTLALGNAMQLPEEPTEEQLAALEVAVQQHKKAIVALASPRASLAPKIAEQLKKAIALANDDETKPKLIMKLEAFLKPQEFTLGFNL